MQHSGVVTLPLASQMLQNPSTHKSHQYSAILTFCRGQGQGEVTQPFYFSQRDITKLLMP